MQRNPRITLVTLAAATLILGSIGLSSAQETSQNSPNQRQQQTERIGKDLTQGTGSGRTTAEQRPLGVCDGTGKGSPGRLGAGKSSDQVAPGVSATGRASNKRGERPSVQAGKIGNGRAGTNGLHSSVRARTRARDLSGTGRGVCAGTGTGSRQRAGRSGVGRRR